MKLKHLVMTLVAAVLLSFSAAATAQTVPHQVTLNWGASTSACVTTVNVHKATTPGGELPVGAAGSNFAAIPVGKTTFTDNSVIAGQVNYWTVSAWGGSCGGTLHESVMSAEIKTTVPADPLPAPAAPTGLTAIVK